jgi:hypothetical membrane protein
MTKAGVQTGQEGEPVPTPGRTRGVGADASAATSAWLADQRIPGVLFFVLAAGFMTVMMLAASMAPDYDIGAAAISDLGVIEETALLFDGSLVLVGLLNALANSLLYRSHRRTGLLAISLAASTGAIGAGLVPLDRGGLHGLFALLAFVAFNLQAISSGRIVTSPMKVLSYVAGTVGLIFVVVMAAGDAGNEAFFGAIGHGGTERMIVYPVMLWLLAFGGYLMAAGQRAGGLARPA